MKKALIIGINYIDNPDSLLHGCINDAQNIRNMLIDVYEYNLNDIIMLRDDSTDPEYMPTRANIIKQLNIIVDMSGELDELWFHYSGHGARVKDHNGDEISGLDSVIVPIDGWIGDDEFLTFITKIKCRALLLFDSCNSGTITDLQWSSEYVVETDEIIVSKNNNKTIDNPNIVVISGSRDDQNSVDVRVKATNNYYGAFTESFIECLRIRKHNVQLIELYKDLCKYLYVRKYVQIPILSTTTTKYEFDFERPNYTKEQIVSLTNKKYMKM